MGSFRPISRIAIIGAGPSGLAAAKYLISEKAFDKIDIFEQRDRVGGIWNLSTPRQSRRIPIPQTNPKYGSQIDQSQRNDIDGILDVYDSLDFESPLYDYLETNIPKQLMAFSDHPFDEQLPLFPGHEAVLEYLERYADDIRFLVHFKTQVISVKLDDTQATDQWVVTTKELGSGKQVTSSYDALVVASGHFTIPNVPDIRGVGAWNKTNRGIIIHSKAYRDPSDFKDKKVIVIGNSASGSDIAAQIGQFCKNPLLLSSRTYNELFQQAPSPWRQDVPEIVEFLPSTQYQRAVKFKDGRIEMDIDAVIFATGYFYNFPFLELSSPLITDGFRTHDVYQHLFHIEHPTIAFPVLNQKVIPFPLAENQAAAIARVWSGRLLLPSHDKMREWERQRIEDRGDGKGFHILKHPEDAEVLNDLYVWAKSAVSREELENNGQGKLGSYWDEQTVWLRSKFPDIKAAFARKGSGRVEIRAPEELGFNYDGYGN